MSDVAPYAGAWIEIQSTLSDWKRKRVAPYAGAWIEIRIRLTLHNT